jgi:import inner membrane translocase subunit TIM22
MREIHRWATWIVREKHRIEIIAPINARDGGFDVTATRAIYEIGNPTDRVLRTDGRRDEHAVMSSSNEGAHGSCFDRAMTATMTSSAFGAVVGCARAALGGSDAPAIVRARSAPALARTIGAVGSGAALFGAIGCAFATTACASESARNVKDAWNGALGGLTAGAVVGLRNGSTSRGASAGAAFAAASMALDASGRKIGRGDEFEDGATPSRIVYPYRKSA